MEPIVFEFMAGYGEYEFLCNVEVFNDQDCKVTLLEDPRFCMTYISSPYPLCEGESITDYGYEVIEKMAVSSGRKWISFLHYIEDRDLKFKFEELQYMAKDGLLEMKDMAPPSEDQIRKKEKAGDLSKSEAKALYRQANKFKKALKYREDLITQTFEAAVINALDQKPGRSLLGILKWTI